MRVIRLEDNFNEAVLPETVQSMPDDLKGRLPLETPKHTPENKRDKANSWPESNYREDEVTASPFGKVLT